MEMTTLISDKLIPAITMHDQPVKTIVGGVEARHDRGFLRRFEGLRVNITVNRTAAYKPSAASRRQEV